jgi:cell wall-associated NlpC family hydrolase
MEEGFLLRVLRTLLHALTIGALAASTLLLSAPAAAEPTSEQVTKQIEQAWNDLEHVIEAYNGIGESLKQTQAAAADVTKRVDELQGQLDLAYSGVRSLAAAAYRGSGELSTLSMFLSAGSTEGIIDQAATLKYVNRSQQRDIARYLELKGKLDDERKRLDSLGKDQASQQSQLASRKTKIETDIRELEALKRRLNVPPPAASAGSTTPSSPPPSVSGAAGVAVSYAYAHLGAPYVYGAEGPSSFDCSGLTTAAWRQAGVRLPHNAAQQWNVTAHISRASLQPGDLVFYSGLGHVAIYVGGNTVIHAPQPGSSVQTASVNMMAPYGYGRPR